MLRSKKYRVVSSFKFTVAYAIMAVVILSGISLISIAIIANIKENIPIIAEAKTIESLSIPEEVIPIVYTEEDVLEIHLQYEEENNELLGQLEDAEIQIMSLSTKYEEAIDVSDKMTEKLYDKYTEYKYVLDAPNSDCTFEDVQMVLKLCKKYSTDKNFAHLWFALIQLESGYNSQAVSRSSTARGWGQILRGTAKDIYENELKLGTYNHDMAYDKSINAEMSIYYLSMLINRYGMTKGLINYNGGELGHKYVEIIRDNLKTNANLAFGDISHSVPKK